MTSHDTRDAHQIRIVFLGAMHHDTGGKGRLLQSIHNLRGRDEPCQVCVAVEWAQATHAALVPMRGELRQRLRTRFPQLKEQFVTRFADTLAYEGDFYQQLNLNVETRAVWMLDGWDRGDIGVSNRNLVEAAIAKKLVDFEDWLLRRIPNWNALSGENMLRQTEDVYMNESRRLAGLSDTSAGSQELDESIRSGREAHMFNSLQRPLTDADKGGHLTVIVITGPDHLINASGSLFQQCKDLGLEPDRRWPHEQ